MVLLILIMRSNSKKDKTKQRRKQTTIAFQMEAESLAGVRRVCFSPPLAARMTPSCVRFGH